MKKLLPFLLLVPSVFLVIAAGMKISSSDSIICFGTNAIPTRTTNEFVFGSTNDLYTFPGTKAAFGYDVAITNRIILGSDTNPTNSIGSLGVQYTPFSGIIDPTIELGLNVTNGGWRIPNAPALWLGLEQNYFNVGDGRYYSEAYVNAIGAVAGTSFRPFAASWYSSEPTNYAYVSVSVSPNNGFHVTRNNDNTDLFYMRGDATLEMPGILLLNNSAARIQTAQGAKIGIGAAAGYDLDLQSTVDIYERIKSTGSGGTHNAVLRLETAAGDPMIYFLANATTEFTVGIDNSDSDKFKISQSYVTGINDRFTVVPTSGFIGISNNVPTSLLHVAGSFAESIATGSAFTLTATNDIYLCNVDAQLITLPTAVGCQGRNYTVKLIAPATTGTVTNAPGILIDGATSYSLTASNKFVHVVSDNANWWIIGNN